MRASVTMFLAGVALLLCFHDGAAQQQTPVVYTAEIDGIIHPVAAEYARGAIEKADAAGAALLVITLRTPGGLVDSTRDINNAIIRAKTPVAIFVGPSGNRATSAGFLITIAADLAVMAPGTHIGAAHPVSGNGEKLDDTMSKKMASDVAGYARTIATQRKRNVALVEQAVIDSRSFTEQEALGATPPLIDLIARDVPDLLQKVDGRTISRFDGRSETLHTAGASLRAVLMTWPQKILSALAHPQIAYLLLTLGTLGLTIELWSPGAVLPGVAGGICLLLAFFAFRVLPVSYAGVLLMLGTLGLTIELWNPGSILTGVVGGICLLLAFFALQVLPVSYAGVLLILFGLTLLILEVKVTSFGLLAAGGVISLFFGSMMLIDSPLPELQVGLRLIVPMTVGIAGILLFLVRLAVQSQRAPPITGPSGMLDEIGQALTAIDPGGLGRVRAHGEIWAATANEPIAAGDPVRITAMNGLKLSVRPTHERS